MQTEVETTGKLSQENLDFFNKLLLKKRKEAVKNLNYLESVNQPSDENKHPVHMADSGTDAQEREKRFFFIQRDKTTIKEIDKALERIKDKTFGICEQTGNLIPYERLEVVPTATFCITVKKTIQNNGGNGRHRR